MDATRSRLGIVIAIVAVVAAIVLGLLVLHRLDQRPRTHDAYLYADTAGMAPDVSGRIVKLSVRENQLVHKGEALVDIDPEPFELRLRQATAQVEALQAQIDLTARQVQAQTSGAGAAQSQVGRARAQLELARESRKRIEPMLSKGYVTAQQLDEARTSERSAEVALQTALQQATQAKQAIADTQSLIAQLEGARAAKALAERDRRNATMLAPFDGQVVGLEIAEGTYAAAGRPLFTLIDTSRWYAVAEFRETELPRVRAGARATVWPMSDTRSPMKGHVESLGGGVRSAAPGSPGALPAADRSLKWVIVAQRFPVRVRLDDPPKDGRLRIGATVSVLVSEEGE
jgi:multidrug efflux system membrane fusion protein